MNSGRHAQPDISLTCTPGKDGQFLVFPYIMENHSKNDAWIMDAVATVNTAGLPVANPDSAVVLQGPGDDVTLGKIIAPLPTDRLIAMPVVPLARHLPRGGTLEGSLRIPMPLAECSPYFADLGLRQYKVIDIKGVIFCVGYWLDGEDNLVVSPTDYAPQLFSVVTRHTVRSARRVMRRYPTQCLQLFLRGDAFPRVGDCAAGSEASDGLASSR